MLLVLQIIVSHIDKLLRTCFNKYALYVLGELSLVTIMINIKNNWSRVFFIAFTILFFVINLSFPSIVSSAVPPYAGPWTSAADGDDEILTQKASFTGAYQTVVGGVTLYPNITSGSFNVTLPACADTSKPTITAAYLSWYNRWRGNDTIVNPAGGVPTFDDTTDLDINGTGATTYTATAADDHWARLIGGTVTTRTYFRRHVFLDVTAQFNTDSIIGVNTIDVSGIDQPTPLQSDPDVQDARNYGAGLNVIYTCPEYSNVTIDVQTGLDFFYSRDDNSYAGDYSDLTCVSFSARTSTGNIGINGILGGQANTAAPYRNAQLWYLTGSGALPTDDSTLATGPAGTVVTNGSAVQIGTGDEAIWTSNLGEEWDLIDNATAISYNIGDEWACIQGYSFDNTATGVSGDILSPMFSIPTQSSYRIGNLVWNDLNNDGDYDSGTESGINGVTVNLYADTNADGDYDSGTDVLQATTTTDANGEYSFSVGATGDYIVVLPASNFAAAAVLDGYVTSTGAANAFEPAPDPDATDTDQDDSGSLLATDVVTTAITISNAGEPTGEATVLDGGAVDAFSGGDNNSNLNC